MKLFFLTATATLLIIFVLVLPAVYRIDPTGLGAKLSIIGLASAFMPITSNPADPEPAPPEGLPTERRDMFTLEIPPKQSRNFTLVMKRDFELDYHWASNGLPVTMELRGFKPNAEAKLFGKLKESRGKGFFIAPFAGKFALRWQNPSDQPITIKLTMKGFYDVPKS